MSEWPKKLETFLLQAKTSNLQTSSYPSEWDDLKVQVSFGIGSPAHVPWIAFLGPGMKVTEGIYPVYLYYKEFEALILAYGVSEWKTPPRQWPQEVIRDAPTVGKYIKQCLDKEVSKYGDSFVFRGYKIDIQNEKVEYTDLETKERVTAENIESDLSNILRCYKEVLGISEVPKQSSPEFQLEEQLQDFLLANWDQTEFGEKYDLITEEGELKSKGYKTDVGEIDILVKDKKTQSHVVIELKKGNPSDKVIGQITRYMGWIKDKKADPNVKGIIIARAPDEKLKYSLKVVPNVDFYIYEIDFKLHKVDVV